MEAALLAAGGPLSLEGMLELFLEEERPEKKDIRAVLKELESDYEGRGIELMEVGGGFRFNVRANYAPWVSRLWEERPARYSRALMETLALIAYRQPITRGEIEEIRGVSVSSNIMKTLLERDWVRVVGQRDVPGKPSLYATTKEFLNYFGLKSLDGLPTGTARKMGRVRLGLKMTLHWWRKRPLTAAWTGNKPSLRLRMMQPNLSRHLSLPPSWKLPILNCRNRVSKMIPRLSLQK